MVSTARCRALKMVRGAAAALLILFAWGVAGCNGKTENATGTAPTSTTSHPADNAAGKYTVGVSLLKQDDDFYKSMQSAMEQAAKANGIKIDVQSADSDQAKQLTQVENFITQHVNAIILCPVDTNNVEAAVRKANDAHIPVFTADIKAAAGKVECHIASDNLMGGKLAAQAMAKLLNEKGSVLIIGFDSVSSVRDRTQGFKDEIAHHPGIALLKEVPGEGKRDVSNTAAANALTQYGKQLNGIFGINDDTAMGALAACKSNHRDDIIIVGYDGSPEARDAIRQGTNLKADAVQYPDRIGKTAVETVFHFLNKEKVASVIPIETGIIDAGNLDKPSELKP